MNIEKLALKIITEVLEKDVFKTIDKMKAGEERTWNVCRNNSNEVRRLRRRLRKQKNVKILSSPDSLNLILKKVDVEEKMDDLGYGMMKTHLDQNY